MKQKQTKQNTTNTNQTNMNKHRKRKRAEKEALSNFIPLLNWISRLLDQCFKIQHSQKATVYQLIACTHLFKFVSSPEGF